MRVEKTQIGAVGTRPIGDECTCGDGRRHFHCETIVFDGESWVSSGSERGVEILKRYPASWMRDTE